MIKAGKYTSALTLIVVGGLLLADIMIGTSYTENLIHWWPALIILLGIEYLILGVVHRGDNRRIGVAAGSIALAVILSVLVIGYHHTDRFNAFHFAFGGLVDENQKPYEKEVSSIPFDESYQKVVLRNMNGNVEMRSGDVDDIQVQATVYVSKLSGHEADRIAEESRIEHRDNGTTLEIEAVGKEYRVFGIRHRPRMNLVITVPQERKADFELLLKNGRISAERIAVEHEFIAGTTNGNITLSRINGNVKADTTNGSIHAEHIGGDLIMDTTNGGIEARNVAGDVAADTTNGGIVIEHAGGKVRADTTNGKIVLTDIGGGIKADTTNGAVTVKSRTIGGDWRLDTTNGLVAVYLPRDASFEVRGDAAVNHMPKTDFPLRVRKGEISGKVNGGGPEIFIDTNGGIEILHLP